MPRLIQGHCGDLLGTADARYVRNLPAVLKCHAQKVISACDREKSHMNAFVWEFFHMSALTFWFKRKVGTFWNPVFPVNQTASPSGHDPDFLRAIPDIFFGVHYPDNGICNAVELLICNAVELLSETQTKTTGGVTGGTPRGIHKQW